MTQRLRDEALRAIPPTSCIWTLSRCPISLTRRDRRYRALSSSPASSRRDDNHVDFKSDIRIGETSTLSLSLQPRPAEPISAAPLPQRRERSRVSDLGRARNRRATSRAAQTGRRKRASAIT